MKQLIELLFVPALGEYIYEKLHQNRLVRPHNAPGHT